MTPEELQANILERFPNATADIPAPQTGLVVKIFPTVLDDVAHYLFETPELSFDYLMSLTAVDYPPEQMDVVYHLSSLTHKHKLTLKVSLNRNTPKVKSVAGVWRAAEWHEREVFDLFGVEFMGHPDLRRILTPEGLVGNPLRKDWTGPDFIPKPQEYTGKG